MRREVARQALGAVAVVAIAVAVLAAALGGPRGLLEALRGMPPGPVALSVALLTAVEAVKALRLCSLSSLGLRGFRACLAARLLGRAAASVTPAGLGGIPTRTAVLASEGRIEFGRAFGAASGETLADNTVAIGLLAVAAALGVSNKVVLAMASLIAAIWVAGILLSVWEGSSDRIYRLLRISGRRRCLLERERRAALEALGLLLKPSRALVVYASTLASHALEYLSVLVFTGSYASPGAWLHAIAAVEAGYMMVFTPAPGGGGGVEYALISFLGPRLALYWRLSYLIASLSPLALAYTVYPRFRDYVGEYSAPPECVG